MIPKPFCLFCEERIDPERAVLVLVEGAARDRAQNREGSWTCGRPACLERLAKAAEEEECELLRPQGIFEPGPRADGLPGWIVWISKSKARDEAEASDLFSAIYRPYTPTAR